MIKKIREWFQWHSVHYHLLSPVWLRLPEKLRWQIVSILNKSNRYCWCDLVDAALCRSEDEDPCDQHLPLITGWSANHCQVECRVFGHQGEHRCACYCGKFKFLASDGWEDRH